MIVHCRQGSSQAWMLIRCLDFLLEVEREEPEDWGCLGAGVRRRWGWKKTFEGKHTQHVFQGIQSVVDCVIPSLQQNRVHIWLDFMGKPKKRARSMSRLTQSWNWAVLCRGEREQRSESHDPFIRSQHPLVPCLPCAFNYAQSPAPLSWVFTAPLTTSPSQGTSWPSRTAWSIAK